MSFPTRKIRTARSANRRTLQPSVTDFSDQVIGCYPEDGGLYLGIASPAKPVNSSIFDPTRGQSPRFAGSIVTYSTLEAAAHSHLPATFDTPRNSIVSPEELHRRHVAKSARLRSRLSGNKQLQRTRILDSPLSSSNSRRCWNSGPGSTTGLYPSPRPASGGGQVKRPWSSDRPTRFIGQETVRARPATTGRYFNSSNGLRTSTTLYRPLSSISPSSPLSVACYRPLTAGFADPSHAWIAGPGLHINKIKLSSKSERYNN